MDRGNPESFFICSELIKAYDIDLDYADSQKTIFANIIGRLTGLNMEKYDLIHCPNPDSSQCSFYIKHK